jgi:60 kDa SS-A/Ro ribonucleoprotein
MLPLIDAFEYVQRPDADLKLVLNTIREHRLPREALPTELLNKAEVWDALLPHMGYEALVRNLGNMSKAGLLVPNANATLFVLNKLESTEQLRASRLHPIKLLAAHLVYSRGAGVRGSGTWQPITSIVDVLDGAFYKAFQNVEPTGKRILVGLDNSGSMQGSECAGVPGLTPAMGSVAMALVTAAVDPQTVITEFTTTIKPSLISPRQRLRDALKTSHRARTAHCR